MSLRVLWTAGFVLCLTGLQLIRAGDHPSYVAAVYEHRVLLNPEPRVPLERRSALKHMQQNLRMFEEQTEDAARQGAQIIVFPEDAIHGFNFTRSSIAGYLETVPDPKEITWSPCSEPDRFPDTEVLRRLSCMAHKNRIFVVANMASRQSCDGHIDPQCPVDGQYQFNTNVVFSDRGTIVARYHKHNLYFEAAFDTPAEPEYITFTTPFAGRFGVFTCFDILFRDPAVTLATDMGVRQMVYPTAWMNQLPLLAAVQFQRAFSSGAGVTLLAANIRAAEYGMTGSGIFTPWDSVVHHDTEGNSGKLLVRSVPVMDPAFVGESYRTTLVPFTGYSKTNLGSELEEAQAWDVNFFSATQGDPKAQFCRTDSDCVETDSPLTFTSIMMYDNFTLTPLKGNKGNLTVCSGSLCCHLLFQRSHTLELYALGVFNGLHVVHGTYYLEVCALVRCTALHHSSCGGETEHAQTLMDFRLDGTFSTRRVFPGILGSGMTLEVPDHSGWESGSRFYMSRRGMSTGLVTAMLYGRHYEKDNI
ncbi:Biotinidase [Triplophysa tibetana]|uniref:Biotinidase n=1 Tax=Triplophysa tibetana TaxID=1572043 RepID=A0A5A9NLZ5_9TELE|nr:Biotinidase [Triplophysa tibetana]